MSGKVQVSHSELLAKQVFDQYLGNFEKIDNVRPDWLQGLEIDRLYPTLGVAIEFQGDQHFRVVPGMHKAPADFQKQLHLDTKKSRLIEENGLKLYSINLYDLDQFRVRKLLKTISDEGKKYAQKKGYLAEVTKLQKIRWDLEPDRQLMKRTDQLSRMKKSYYRSNKKSWWRQLFRV